MLNFNNEYFLNCSLELNNYSFTTEGVLYFQFEGKKFRVAKRNTLY